MWNAEKFFSDMKIKKSKILFHVEQNRFDDFTRFTRFWDTNKGLPLLV